MTTPSKKTMFSYFTKLPSKTSIVENENPRKSAPMFNRQHVEEFQKRSTQFDEVLANPDLFENKSLDGTYLNLLKSEYKAFKIHRRVKGPLRARLLQFCEDVRPPYFGTWQKKSKSVVGRRPFGQDNDVFDYEVDSEAEWDLGGPGESLKGDDSEEEEEMDDYEIDMKTFVPHGYVSDDEIEQNSDSEQNSSAKNPNPSKEVGIGDDSDSDIKIIADLRPTQAAPQPKQTPKTDIKAITLGLSYEDAPTISESKLQFLKAFQGVSCN